MTGPFFLLRTALLLMPAFAEVIRIDATPELTFHPDTVTAEEGDVLEFHFLGGNHSVATGSFLRACTPADQGGFFSGYFPDARDSSDDVFSVTLESADPMVFYSTQGSECARGMAGVVNQEAGEETLTSYRASALGLSTAVSPAKPYGGDRDGLSSDSPSKPSSKDQSGSSAEDAAAKDDRTDGMPYERGAAALTDISLSTLAAVALAAWWFG